MKTRTNDFLKLTYFLTFSFLLFTFSLSGQNVVITDDNSYTPSSSNAILEVEAGNNNKGILIPRLSAAQRTAMSPHTTHDVGLLVFDTDSLSFWYHNGSGWIEIDSADIVRNISDADKDTKIIVEQMNDEDYIYFYTAGNNVMYIDDAGKVSISNYVELPSTSSSTTGVIYKGSSSFLHNYKASSTDGANTFVGKDAGNFSMSRNSSITDASYNSGFGAGTFKDLTTGGYNTASGAYALYNNTTANNNVAVGTATLLNTTTGGSNTAIGQKSGYSNQTGSGNVFIGNEAGYNETGSNKLYIDNSNTSTPLIYGDFSTNAVTINGTIKITGGSPGVGQVLTSDASGNASWQAGGAGGGAADIDDLNDANADATSVFLGDGCWR
jgi:hypothetical protein